MTLQEFVIEAISSKRNTVQYKLTKDSEMLDFLEAFKNAGMVMKSLSPENSSVRGKEGHCWMILRHDLQQTIVRLFLGGKEYMMFFNYKDQKLEMCIRYENQNGRHVYGKGDYNTETNIEEICDKLGMVSEAISSGVSRSIKTRIEELDVDMSMREFSDILGLLPIDFYDNEKDLRFPIAVNLLKEAIETDKISWCYGSCYTPFIYIAIPEEELVYDIDFNGNLESNKRGISNISIYKLGSGNSLEFVESYKKSTRDKSLGWLKISLGEWI